MDSESVLFKLSFFSHPDASTFHLFVGFHFMLKHYGGWVRPLHLKCQYSTVTCVIELHEIFQMWLRSLTNGGGSFPCNTDAIFIVFNNSFNFVMVLNFRDAYPPWQQPLVPRPRGFLTRKRHERHLLLLIFFQNFRDIYPHLQQLLLPRPPCFLTHEDRVLLLIFSQIRILFSAPTGFMALPRPGVFVVVSCSGTPDQGSLFHPIQDPSNYSVVVAF